MNIDRPSSYSAISSTAVRSATTKPVSSVAGSKPATDDSAVRQSDASKIASGGAPVDQAKIDSIREQIASGSYIIDVQALAQRMVAMDILGDA